MPAARPSCPELAENSEVAFRPGGWLRSDSVSRPCFEAIDASVPSIRPFHHGRDAAMRRRPCRSDDPQPTESNGDERPHRRTHAGWRRPPSCAHGVDGAGCGSLWLALRRPSGARNRGRGRSATRLRRRRPLERRWSDSLLAARDERLFYVAIDRLPLGIVASTRVPRRSSLSADVGNASRRARGLGVYVAHRRRLASSPSSRSWSPSRSTRLALLQSVLVHAASRRPCSLAVLRRDRRSPILACSGVRLFAVFPLALAAACRTVGFVCRSPSCRTCFDQLAMAALIAERPTRLMVVDSSPRPRRSCGSSCSSRSRRQSSSPAWPSWSLRS